MFETLRINLRKNVFHDLYWVPSPGLHKPDLLHTVDPGLFKNMIDWVKGLLQKHAQL